MKTLLLSALLFSVQSFAADGDPPADEAAPAEGEAEVEEKDGPHFLLADLGVQLNIDENEWKMTRWSDWDFEAELERGRTTLKIFARATAFQAPITEADKEGWDRLWRLYAQTKGGVDAELQSSELVDHNGTGAYRVEYGMKTPGEEPQDLTILGFSIPVKGQVFHLSVASLSKNKAALKTELDKAIAALDIQAPADEPSWGGTVTGIAGSTTVSSYWRAPMPSETDATELVAQKFQLGYIRDCWQVVHPTGVKGADVMVSCQQSKHQVGILDDYTYGDIAPEVSEKVLRGLPLGEPERLDIGGRVGFYWSGKVKSDTFYVAAIPNAEGIATIWARGSEGNGIGDSVKEAALAGTYTASPEIEFRDQVAYFVKYRPTHPYVIAPVAIALLILLMIIGLIVYGAATQKSYDDDWI